MDESGIRPVLLDSICYIEAGARRLRSAAGRTANGLVSLHLCTLADTADTLAEQIKTATLGDLTEIGKDSK